MGIVLASLLPSSPLRGFPFVPSEVCMGEKCSDSRATSRHPAVAINSYYDESCIILSHVEKMETHQRILHTWINLLTSHGFPRRVPRYFECAPLITQPLLDLRVTNGPVVRNMQILTLA